MAKPGIVSDKVVELEYDLLILHGENGKKESTIEIDNFKKIFGKRAEIMKLNYEIRVNDGKMKGGSGVVFSGSATSPYSYFEYGVNYAVEKATQLNDQRKRLVEALFGEFKPTNLNSQAEPPAHPEDGLVKEDVKILIEPDGSVDVIEHKQEMKEEHEKDNEGDAIVEEELLKENIENIKNIDDDKDDDHEEPTGKIKIRRVILMINGLRDIDVLKLKK
jgi:hypothetical protein